MSLDRHFLVNNRFETKLFVNKMIVPDASVEGSNSLLVKADLLCLLDKEVKGKALISLFPEELYVLDFYANCSKNEVLIRQSFDFSLQLLQPLLTFKNLNWHTPQDAQISKTYVVKPGQSCIYKVVSKKDQQYASFPYKKPKIEFETTPSIHNENLYSYNGIDIDGGIFRHNTAIEINMNCHPGIEKPTFNATFQFYNGEFYKISCQTDCSRSNTINRRLNHGMFLIGIILIGAVIIVCYCIITNLGAFNKIKEREVNRQKVLEEIRAEKRQESMGGSELEML